MIWACPHAPIHTSYILHISGHLFPWVCHGYIDPPFVELVTLAPQVDVQPCFNALVAARCALGQFWADLFSLCFDTALASESANASAQGIVDPIPSPAYSTEDGMVSPYVTLFVALVSSLFVLGALVLALPLA